MSDRPLSSGSRPATPPAITSEGNRRRNVGLWLTLSILLLPLLSPHRHLAAQTDPPAFTSAWVSTEAAVTRSIAWGDYDNDGDLDLVVGNNGPNHLYRNDHGVLTTVAVWTSEEADTTRSVAWGDYDGDGDLDLVVGNEGQPNRLYRNDGGVLTTSAVWSSEEADTTRSVAWGDYDGDGDLDLAVGNGGQPIQLYRNDGGTLTTGAVWSSADVDPVAVVLWGDYDNDGDLDLAVGRNGVNELHRNDGGVLTASAVWSSDESDPTTDAGWGDYDGDGDLDLVAGNGLAPHRLYRNDGGMLTTGAVWSSVEQDLIWSVAWGDYDADGDLDLLTGGGSHGGVPNRIYRNDGGVLTAEAIWTSAEVDYTIGVAWGDYDNDGDLDIAVGNLNQPNRLYRNDGVVLDGPVWTSAEEEPSSGLAWGDYDGDGDLDLVVGNDGQPNRLYRNDDGVLTTGAVWSSDEADATRSVAWGDYDGDGDLDLVVGNDGQPNRLYRNDDGVLTTGAVWSSDEADTTRSVAWGDYDGDGDLDLAVGNGRPDFAGQSNRLYRNDGGVLTSEAVWSSAEEDNTTSLSWGDYDGDGDLDLAVGNGTATGQPNRLYRNDDGVLTTSAVWSSDESDRTSALAWGDYDGDGDLDLVAGNHRQPNRLYRNDGGVLATEAVWSSAEADSTPGLAWGDYDGDGDLDLAVSSVSRNLLYRNPRRTPAPSVNDPPYVVIPRPGPTHDAPLAPTPHIITQTQVSILYTLFDPEGDPVARIFPEFSPNGGGAWFPATPGPGGDGTTALSASPEGTSHLFVWDAGADLIKSDNVVFRIRAQPGYRLGPILWPAQDGKSPPFRVAAPWFIRVVDEGGNPVAGATVYADGEAVGTTDRAGLLNAGPLDMGTTLVALALQAEQPTARAGHGGWAYRVYRTSLIWDTDGSARPFVVSGSGEQRLVLRESHPLILFNLLVSIEWDATQAYLDEIARAVRYASDYLYDLTDGQMALGQVALYDDGAYWAEADVQVATKNVVRPHAYVGGITSDDRSHVIRIGRGWDGHSSNQGAWDRPEGYRTLAHEFGHYALYLYDEYFAYLFDQDGNLIGEVPASCTGPENRNPATDATNASAMDYHYTSSELAMRGVPGLWSDRCENTAQWQLRGESDWETLGRMYGDVQDPPRWRLATPADRGGVVAGPEGMPSSLPAWPLVQVHQEGPSPPPRQLTVYGPQGPYWGAIVALYKQDGRVIGQGFTDGNGRLAVYGAIAGDTLRAASFDGGLAGSVTVGTAMTLNLTMAPVTGSAVQSTGSIPHLRVVAEPGQDPDRIDLLIFLLGFGPDADPTVVITEPGGETGYVPTLAYSPATGIYSGAVSLEATARGMGRIRAVGSVGERLVWLQATYRLHRVTGDRSWDLYANDGNLSLHLASGSLPGNGAYVVITPPGAVPGPPPQGLVPVGHPYDITASGALASLERPAVLKLHYDDALITSSVRPEALGLYRWDPVRQTWVEVPAHLDEGQQAVVAPVTALGTYLLLASPGSGGEPFQHVLFLPLLLKEGGR